MHRGPEEGRLGQTECYYLQTSDCTQTYLLGLVVIGERRSHLEELYELMLEDVRWSMWLYHPARYFYKNRMPLELSKTLVFQTYMSCCLTDKHFNQLPPETSASPTYLIHFESMYFATAICVSPSLGCHHYVHRAAISILRLALSPSLSMEQ